MKLKQIDKRFSKILQRRIIKTNFNILSLKIAIEYTCSLSFVLMFQRPSKTNHTLLCLLLVIIQTSRSISLTSQAQEGCLTYNYHECIKCRDNYHLHDKHCHKNIEGCKSYEYKSQNQYYCVECDHGYFIMEDSGICFISAVSKKVNASRILIEGSSSACASDEPSQQFQDLQNNTYFKSVDEFMRKSEYKHFITGSSSYIKSVNVQYDALDANFRIIYYSSGGGLMLCIISINIINKNIQLRSFVAIDAGKIVNYCSDYDAGLKCNACQSGFHLHEGACYKSIENCVRHFRNLCVQCRQYSLLIENRCISDCGHLSDTNKIRLFGDIRLIRNNILAPIEQSYLLAFS